MKSSSVYFSTTGMMLRPIFVASITASIVLVILEAVTDDRGAIVRDGQHGEELGLGARLQAVTVGSSKREYLLDDLALLVDLDWIDAAVATLVGVVLHRLLECPVDVGQTLLEDVGEADEDGRRDTSQHERVGQLSEIDRSFGILVGVDEKVPVVSDREVALAPPGHIVELTGLLNRPRRGSIEHGFRRGLTLQLASCEIATLCGLT